MRWLSIVLVLLAAPLPAQEKVQYSNWRFELPAFLRKKGETKEALTVGLLPEVPGPGATFTFRPGRKTTDSPKKEVERLWGTTLGARKPTEDAVDEEPELADGTKGFVRSARLPGGGWVLVGAWAPKGGLDVLVLEAKDDVGAELAISGLMMIQMSLAFGPVDGNATPGAEAHAAPPPEPTPLPPDPSEGIDWDAPRTVVRTLRDADEIAVDEQLEEFVAANRGLLGGVAPLELDVATAMQRVRAMLQLERNAAAVRFLREDRSLPDADTMQQCAAFALLEDKPAHALLSLYVAHERWPGDLRVRFDLAALLARGGAINEATALLRDLRKGGKIFESTGPVSSGAMLAYLEAFCLTRLGSFEAAAALLRPIAAAEPFFGEAALLLALLEHKLGNPARQMFLSGSFRRGGGMMHRGCGTGRQAICMLPPEGEDDVVELVVEEFIDMSRGVPGKLPVPTLPSGLEASMAWAEWFERIQPAWQQELQTLSEQLQRRSVQWKEAVPPDSPMWEWHNALDDILAEDRARLPELQALRRAAEKASDEYAAAEERAGAPLVERINRIVARGQHEPAKFCPELKAAVLQEMADFARHAANLATAERRVFRLWHQYATALGASVSDPAFRAYLDTYIRHVRRNYRYGHFLMVWKWAKLATYADECTKIGKAGEQDEGEDDDLPDCDDEDRKHSLGVSMGPIGVEASCEGVSVEVEAPIFVNFLTLSVEASFGFDGSTTVYAGPKAKGEIPIISSVSTSPSLKGGGYLQFKDGKVVDAGLRSEAKFTTKAGPVTHGYKSERQLSFVPAPDSPMGRAFGVGQFGR